MGKGMAAWVTAWRALPVLRLPVRPAATAAPAEIVSVLASMALRCVGD